MNRPISIHEAAENELNDAADFYDLESPGLGEAFINEIHKAVDLIAHFPEASQLIRGRIRRKVLIKFPYALIIAGNRNPDFGGSSSKETACLLAGSPMSRKSPSAIKKLLQA